MEEFDKGDIVSYQGRKAIVCQAFTNQDIHPVLIEFMEYERDKHNEYIEPEWIHASQLTLIEKSTHIDFPAYCKLQFAKF